MSVRPIDRFIGAMHRDRAEELLFETGKPVRLRLSNSDRILLAQDVRTDQIENLVREVVPPDCQRIFEDTGEVSFPYQAPTGTVMVQMLRQDRRLVVTVSVYSPAKQRIAKSAPIAVGAENTMIIESPLETIHGGAAPMSIVTGAPVARARSPVAQARQVVERKIPPRTPPVRQSPPPPPPAQNDLVSQYIAPFVEAPMELPLESVAPPALPAEALRKLSSVPPPAPAAAPAKHATLARIEPLKSRREGAAKIDRILQILVQQKGSDLHLTAQLAPKMRKDGDIQGVPGFTEPLSSDTLKDWLLEISPENMAQKFEDTNDTDFAYEIPGVARFRVNVFRDRRGVGGVLRVIPSKILTADDLRLPPVVRDLCGLQKGLVVVTGPTGSGKSTTLAAMLDLINKTRSDHVITIEDPVEFVHEPQRCLVNQREVHSHTKSFSAALRAALREDPDIVLVGEMRDLETVSIAIETAETGHLVFGTLHTNTAVSTVDRVIDQFPTDRQSQVRVMLSESLKGVVAQTLCKKIGGGRVAALEILIALPAVANMIREGKTFQIPSIMQTSKGAGMQTLNDALLALVKESLIEPREAYTKAVARSEMKAALERAGHKLD